MCALPPRRSLALLIETYFSVLNGRVLAYDQNPLGAEGILVCVTAASNLSNAHAALTATHPTVTRAFLISLACDVSQGQVHLHEVLREIQHLAEVAPRLRVGGVDGSLQPRMLRERHA